MTSTPLHLATAISPVRHHQALLEGSVTIPGVELRPVPPGPDYADRFKKMCRELAFDVCELSVMSYFAAREIRLPISAIPVVPILQLSSTTATSSRTSTQASSRRWTWWASGSAPEPTRSPPACLIGAFSARSSASTWTRSPGSWPSRSTWRRSRTTIRPTSSLGRMRTCSPGWPPVTWTRASPGATWAVSGHRTSRHCSRTQKPRPRPVRAHRHRARVRRVITVKTALLDEHPWLAEALYDAFTAARAYGVEPNPTVAKVVDGDPVPIGLAANRASFEELLALGHEQKILTRPFAVDDLFPALG